MTKTGVTHTSTAEGEGGGRLTENPAPPAKDGGIRPKDDQPARFTGERRAEEASDEDKGGQG